MHQACSGAHRGQKRSDPLELEFQALVSCPNVGAGNLSWWVLVTHPDIFARALSATLDC